MEVTIIKEYGVVHLKNALDLEEQKSLFEEIVGSVRGFGNAPSTFHLSSGDPGSSNRNEFLHTIGSSLFLRCATAVTSNLSVLEISDEPSLKRLGDAASGAKPPNINNVTGVSYKPAVTMNNHSDLNRPIYTMSVALGGSCDFTVGKRTNTPHANERSGNPVTIRMASGDAIYFDGGAVPHQVSNINTNTAPSFFTIKSKPKNIARISVLFREPC
jgi:alkylated DNA repair dioxygenase AlkB